MTFVCNTQMYHAIWENTDNISRWTPIRGWIGDGAVTEAHAFAVLLYAMRVNMYERQANGSRAHTTPVI